MAIRPACLSLALLAAGAAQADRVELGGFAIDRTEVSLGRFAAFAAGTGLVTAAEAAGGGHEWGAGWERRSGWTYLAPFGAAGAMDEPATHVSWSEAHAFCAWAGGRLPSRADWSAAAYRQQAGRPGPPPGLYPYPTGPEPDGANTRAEDPWPRHAPVGRTKPGVNGLQDMGGNVWEWLADRNRAEALTAGGSWWYGPEQMRAEAMQWKPADFYAVYIGFRCAYDPPR